MFSISKRRRDASRTHQGSRKTSHGRSLRFERMESRDLLAAVMVSPTAGLQTSEDGGYAVVSVYLKDPPTANVVLSFLSGNPKEGRLSVGKLTFTPSNYNKPQSFRVIGVSDGVIDGDKYYQVCGKSASTDPAYNGLAVPAISLKNLDSRTLVAGITVTPTSGLQTTKSGGTAQFTIKLNYKPTSPVTIPLATTNAREGIPNVTAVTFTSANWNVPQPVVVTGQPDGLFGPANYRILTGPAISMDPNYNGMNAADVSLVNMDRTDAGRFDGNYVGSYTGTSSAPGYPAQPVSGAVQFSVSNGIITVQAPSGGTGQLAANGSASFGVSGGLYSGATFSGVFTGKRGTNAATATGAWSFNQSGVTANGSWTAARV
jgi:hypothetical protein